MKEKKAELSKRSIATKLAQDASRLSRAKGCASVRTGLSRRPTRAEIGSRCRAASMLTSSIYRSLRRTWAGPSVRAGLTIRTTDGGKTWSRIPTPTREDLIKVSATTELAARIKPGITRSGKQPTAEKPGAVLAPNKCHLLRSAELRDMTPSPPALGRGGFAAQCGASG